MKRTENFEDLRRCDEFVLVNRQTSEWRVMGWLADCPANMDYMYFYEKMSMQPLRMYKGELKSYVCLVGKYSIDDVSKVRKEILEGSIDNINETIKHFKNK